MTDEPREFQFGLVMAGAISAGAYTAGVMDFLLEALEAWEAAKLRDPASVPNHVTRIRALSGSSAGAMVSAILVRSLASTVTPVANVNAPPDTPHPDPTQQRDEFKNPFYAAWVQSIDICHLLGGRDLAPRAAKVTSVLDSTVLGYIGTNVLTVSSPPRSQRPAYASNPIDIFLTTVNLRGVPYGFGFAGQQTAYSHQMTAYADQMHFVLTWPTEDLPPPSEGAVDTAPIVLNAMRVGSSENWAKLMDTALSSGAFPIGLAPRLLRRKAADYDARLWPVPESEPLVAAPDGKADCRCSALRPIVPSWPDGIRLVDPDPAKTVADPAFDYEYWNVDGGLMNNEPLELVRRVLSAGGRNPRAGEKADRAVIMVDPFPNSTTVTKDYDTEIDLFRIILRMFGALKEQARFKPDELALAATPGVYSRFVISPLYSDATGARIEPAMASAIMGGFGGFFSESFRRHDFQLGRRNCQRFLQRYFVLPIENPLFDHWRGNAALVERFSFEDEDEGRTRRFAPIIPLMDHLDPGVRRDAEVMPPPRPRVADVDLAALHGQVRERVDLVGPRLLDSAPISSVLRWIIWRAAILLGLRRKIVDGIMAKIEREIAVLG